MPSETLLPPPPVRIAHITDAHITPRGHRTAVLKDKAVEILRDLVGQSKARGVDHVLFGGDNIDNREDGEADLAAFLEVANEGPAWSCIVGNHEAPTTKAGSGRISRERFAEAVDGHGIGPGRASFSTAIGNVRVVGIDTTLIGNAGGYVTERAMAFLAGELRRAEEEHIVVLGHHLLAAPWAPYRNDAWDAEYLVQNRESVIGLLASCPRVRAYLCGHHHGSRIHRIAGRGEGGGFYHILTASPVAYPCAARVLRFEEKALVVESLRPSDPKIVEEAALAVMTGRKAQRYQTLGTARKFRDYLAGSAADNDATLPYDQRRLPTGRAVTQVRLPSAASG